MNARTFPATSAEASLQRSIDILARGQAEFHADVERMCVADVHRLCSTVRNGITVLQTTYRQRAESAADIVGCLIAIDVPYESHHGHLAVAFSSLEEVANLFSLLTQHCPREVDSIIQGAAWDVKAGWIWWPGTVTE